MDTAAFEVGPVESRPARDAWVEIARPARPPKEGNTSRPARDAWVEIDVPTCEEATTVSRVPQGTRGLK